MGISDDIYNLYRRDNWMSREGEKARIYTAATPALTNHNIQYALGTTTIKNENNKLLILLL